MKMEFKLLLTLLFAIFFVGCKSYEEVNNLKLYDFEDYINKEIKVYTEEDHLNKVSEKTKKLYESLKNKILELDDIDIDVKKVYVAFKGRRNIVDIEFNQNKLKVDINLKKGTLVDPLNIAQDITKVGHWGNGDYRVEVSSEEDIDNLIPLIKQSLKVNKK